MAAHRSVELLRALNQLAYWADHALPEFAREICTFISCCLHVPSVKPARDRVVRATSARLPSVAIAEPPPRSSSDLVDDEVYREVWRIVPQVGGFSLK